MLMTLRSRGAALTERTRDLRSGQGRGLPFINQTTERGRTMWTKPSYTDLRIGFEVTMYFANR